MTHTSIYASVIIGLLLVLLAGVWRVIRQTRWVVHIANHLTAPQEEYAPDDSGFEGLETKPIGFHSTRKD